MEQIRSFIAVELPENVKTGLKEIQGRLKSENPSIARWVDPAGIHLTLKFLGNVPANQVEAISRSIKKAAAEVSPFSLEIKGLGAFPSLARPQVVWTGLSGDIDRLNMLQKSLEIQVSPLGFPSEKRPFSPHLTLARLRDTATAIERQKLGEKISNIQFSSGFHMNVNSVNLMRSQLTPAGAIYTRLFEIDL
ncbi:MAG: RNA 2',3'-cyclic phosphodiesterase [Dehalococcoidales bacterium]|nr:RNA 2',3'-cyclic phosphodiesterase [Dehalococcoidales bacterium]